MGSSSTFMFVSLIASALMSGSSSVSRSSSSPISNPRELFIIKGMAEFAGLRSQKRRTRIKH